MKILKLIIRILIDAIRILIDVVKELKKMLIMLKNFNDIRVRFSVFLICICLIAIFLYQKKDIEYQIVQISEARQTIGIFEKKLEDNKYLQDIALRMAESFIILINTIYVNEILDENTGYILKDKITSNKGFEAVEKHLQKNSSHIDYLYRRRFSQIATIINSYIERNGVARIEFKIIVRDKFTGAKLDETYHNAVVNYDFSPEMISIDKEFINPIGFYVTDFNMSEEYQDENQY